MNRIHRHWHIDFPKPCRAHWSWQKNEILICLSWTPPSLTRCRVLSITLKPRSAHTFSPMCIFSILEPPLLVNVTSTATIFVEYMQGLRVNLYWARSPWPVILFSNSWDANFEKSVNTYKTDEAKIVKVKRLLSGWALFRCGVLFLVGSTLVL